MKKILLCSAALVGVAFAAAPAMAQVDVTVGGHTKNYMGYLSQDTTAGNEERNFDMVRESELHFNAEGTADNGLTYGFHVESEVDGGDAFAVEESYLYLASNLGRVNLGSEDGAQYLLQVAAPSADANIDGLRQYINPINAAILPGGVSAESDYDADNFSAAVDEKVTYLSPNWSGFQFGLSYTPEAGDSLVAINGFNTDDTENDTGSVYEGAVRYEGNFNNVGFAVGAGYAHANVEEDAVDTHEDGAEWNVGADLDIGAFGVGAAYKNVDGTLDGDSDEIDTYVLGADYTTGPFVFGASYLNSEVDSGQEQDRYTGGVVYTVTEGLTLRGSVGYSDFDNAGTDADATSVLGGVQFNF
jgi:outer membrane protein OmpU